MTTLRQNARAHLGRIYRSLFSARFSRDLPRPALQEKHIRNAKLLTDRTALLKLMPPNGVVAELGVDEGKFSQQILDHAKPAKLHLVDLWATDRYNRSKREAVEKQFDAEIRSGRIEINVGLSTDVVSSFKDDHFDWIYIDTDHTYKTTLAELIGYEKKVKKSGIIAGHDYVIGNWDDHVRYGVIEAVHQFCIEHDWELIYITSDLNRNPSFAIRRIWDLQPERTE